jgi:hypothetical protein
MWASFYNFHMYTLIKKKHILFIMTFSLNSIFLTFIQLEISKRGAGAREFDFEP